MKTLICLALAASISNAEPPAMTLAQWSLTCFHVGQSASGLARICYYDCVGSRVAITIPVAQICPISIQG